MTDTEKAQTEGLICLNQGCGIGAGAGVARSRGNERGVGVGVDQTVSTPTSKPFV